MTAMVVASHTVKSNVSRVYRRAQFLDDNWLSIRLLNKPDRCPPWEGCRPGTPLSQHDHGSYCQIHVRRTSSEAKILTADGFLRDQRKYGLLVDYWAPKGEVKGYQPTPDEVVSYLAYIAQLPYSADEIMRLPSSEAKGVLAVASIKLSVLRRNFDKFFKEDEIKQLKAM